MSDSSDIWLAVFLTAVVTIFLTCVFAGKLDLEFDQARTSIRDIADVRTQIRSTIDERTRAQRELAELRAEIDRLLPAPATP